MKNCAFCRKTLLIKFIMSMFNLKATDIAKEIHVSDSLVRKHIEGFRNCELVDVYLIEKGFGLHLKVSE